MRYVHLRLLFPAFALVFARFIGTDVSPSGFVLLILVGIATAAYSIIEAIEAKR
jgi:hypothetical protein